MPCQIWFQTVNFDDLSGKCLELLCGLRIKDEGLLTDLREQAFLPDKKNVRAVTHQGQRVVTVSGFTPR